MKHENERYRIETATEQDVEVITAIYNSNPTFLAEHLGQPTVDSQLVREELDEMRQMSFDSAVITDKQLGKIVAYSDFQTKSTVYFSLLLVDGALQDKGRGREIYALLEEYFRKLHCRTVRIDVVYGYKGNAVGFWEHCGFCRDGEGTVEWHDKSSPASIMKKTL